MTANLQLQINGNNIETYNIYQNSDSYVTAVATSVTAAELQSGYELTLDNSSTFVRLVANGACGTYKDISINFSDPTPSIVYNDKLKTSSSNFGTSRMSIVTDGVNRVLAVDGTFYVTSSNNGANWQAHGSNEGGYPICDKNGDFFMLKGDTTIQLYKIVNWEGTTTRQAVTCNLTLQPNEVVTNYYYFNGIYYIRTTLSLYRSEDNLDYVKVLDAPYGKTSQFSFVGYGNVIYLSNVTSLYKSIDDGVNWVEIQNSGNFTNLYVEDENKVLVYDTSDLEWKFSIDGGESFSTSWLPSMQVGNKANVVVKSAGIYYYQSGFNCGTVNHTTTTPFSTTDTGNANYELSGINIVTNPSYPVTPEAFSINISNNRIFCLGYINSACVADGVNIIISTVTPT